MWLTTGRPQRPEKKGGVPEADRDGGETDAVPPGQVYGRCLAELNTGSISGHGLGYRVLLQLRLA